MDFETQQQINDIWKEINSIKNNDEIPDHQHTGLDASKVVFSSIDKRRVWINHTIAGTAAATAANYGVFWIAPFACNLISFKEVHQTAGGDAGAVTVTLEKLTGTQALDAGVVMLSAALSLKAIADTVQTGVLTNTFTDRNLAIGNRLALKDSGTLTSVANVSVILELNII